MKTYEVIGIEEVNYTSKKSNRQVTGRKLHLTFDFEKDDSSEGTGVEVCFTNCDSVYNVNVGDLVELLYNKYGSIVDVRVLV